MMEFEKEKRKRREWEDVLRCGCAAWFVGDHDV